MSYTLGADILVARDSISAFFSFPTSIFQILGDGKIKWSMISHGPGQYFGCLRATGIFSLPIVLRLVIEIMIKLAPLSLLCSFTQPRIPWDCFIALNPFNSFISPLLLYFARIRMQWTCTATAFTLTCISEAITTDALVYFFKSMTAWIVPSRHEWQQKPRACAKWG